MTAGSKASLSRRKAVKGKAASAGAAGADTARDTSVAAHEQDAPGRTTNGESSEAPQAETAEQGKAVKNTRKTPAKAKRSTTQRNCKSDGTGGGASAATSPATPVQTASVPAGECWGLW